MDSAGPMAGRNQSFNDGMTGTPDSVATSLDVQSAKQNELVPKQFQAHSVLQQYIPSANGLGTADAARRLVGGGMLPSPNGYAQDTYEASRPLQNNRLNG